MKAKRTIHAADLRAGDRLLGSERDVISVTQLANNQVRVTSQRGQESMVSDWNARTTVTILRRDDPPPQ